MKHFLLLFGLFCCLASHAAENLPPAPKDYFNDYSGVVSEATATQLNEYLRNFEKDTSSQLLVAVYPKMQSQSSIEDYTLRVARAWRVGQKMTNNGAVLFVFINDHKMFIQVGYGLEGAMPDVTCKRIIEDEIAPKFKTGDFDGGFKAGVNAMMAAAKGEYKGTGKTVQDKQEEKNQDYTSIVMGIIFAVFILFVIFNSIFNGRGGLMTAGWLISSIGSSDWSGGGRGGGGGGGGFSGGGGGGGGFSGGGGSFGGGGAGGSW